MSLLVTQEEVVHDGAVVEVLQRRHVLHPSDAAVVHELHLLPREGVLLVGVDLEEQKITRFCDGRHWFSHAVTKTQFKKHRENIVVRDHFLSKVRSRLSVLCFLETSRTSRTEEDGGQ